MYRENILSIQAARNVGSVTVKCLSTCELFNRAIQMQTSQSWGNCKVTVEPAGVARSGMWLKRGSGEAYHITLTQQDGEPPGQCWANRTGRRMNGSVNGISQ